MVDAHFDALEPITSTGLQRLTNLTGLTKLFVYARLDDDYLEADLVSLCLSVLQHYLPCLCVLEIAQDSGQHTCCFLPADIVA